MSENGPEASPDPSAEAPAPRTWQGKEAPGWDAITELLAHHYPGIEPRHVGYPPGVAFGAALQGCSAYPDGDSWHYVTFGLSELYVPEENPDPVTSGWGIELTLRVPRDPEAPGSAPDWPFGVLSEIAAHARRAGPLLVGDRVARGAPVTGFPGYPDAPPTGLTAYAFTVDGDLQVIGTPWGHVVFLQVVGITEAERLRMIATSTRTVLEELRAASPNLVLDPARA